MLPEPVEALPTIAGGDEEGPCVEVGVGLLVTVQEGVPLDVAVEATGGVSVAVMVKVAAGGVFVAVAPGTVWVLVGVDDALMVADKVKEAVRLGLGVALPVAVEDGLAVADALGEDVALAVGVGVAVGEDVALPVPVKLAVGVPVPVCVEVWVCGVFVPVAVAPAGVGELVGVESTDAGVSVALAAGLWTAVEVALELCVGEGLAEMTGPVKQSVTIRTR